MEPLRPICHISLGFLNMPWSQGSQGQNNQSNHNVLQQSLSLLDNASTLYLVKCSRRFVYLPTPCTCRASDSDFVILSWKASQGLWHTATSLSNNAKRKQSNFLSNFVSHACYSEGQNLDQVIIPSPAKRLHGRCFWIPLYCATWLVAEGW